MIFPHLYLDRVVDLKLAYLHERKLRGLLIDVDGTLKDYTVHEVASSVVDWVDGLRAGGVQLCILSNGREHRIGQLAATLDVPFVAKAFKPFPFGCLTALRTMGLDAREAAIVGDQVFADVLAGKLARLHTVLVRPTSYVEPWFTRLKRPFEYPITWRMRRLAAKAAAAAHAKALAELSSSSKGDEVVELASELFESVDRR